MAEPTLSRVSQLAAPAGQRFDSKLSIKILVRHFCDTIAARIYCVYDRKGLYSVVCYHQHQRDMLAPSTTTEDPVDCTFHLVARRDKEGGHWTIESSDLKHALWCTTKENETADLTSLQLKGSKAENVDAGLLLAAMNPVLEKFSFYLRKNWKRDVAGDGSCFFRSVLIAIGLTGTNNEVRILRYLFSKALEVNAHGDARSLASVMMESVGKVRPR